jgi:hypothetical protein
VVIVALTAAGFAFGLAGKPGAALVTFGIAAIVALMTVAPGGRDPRP